MHIQISLHSDIVIPPRQRATKSQRRTTVSILVEVLRRPNLQPPIPGPPMIHTQTLRTAKPIPIHFVKILLNSTGNRRMLGRGIAVPARGVVHPRQSLVGAMHAVAGPLVGEFLDGTREGLHHGFYKGDEH